MWERKKNYMIGQHGTDQTTLAYINLYGVLGTLENLCRLDEEAKALIADRKVSIGFAVQGGPAATLYFDHGTCTLKSGRITVISASPFPVRKSSTV